jgi:orotidine-5'-phosphate decarboxylase
LSFILLEENDLLERNTGVILALDVDTKEKAMSVCQAARDHVDAIKVGYPLVLRTGLDIIKDLDFGKPVIADFKVADIPMVSRTICDAARAEGAEYVIIHGFVGEDVLKECSQGGPVFVVTEMSHPGATSFMAPAAEDIAAMATEHAFGIVAPATRPERISELREVVGSDIVIISPGVATQGGEPGGAIAAGADFEIIGRGIYNAEDPGEAAKGYAEKIGLRK